MRSRAPDAGQHLYDGPTRDLGRDQEDRLREPACDLLSPGLSGLDGFAMDRCGEAPTKTD
jgi:hypothetical protein